MDVYDTIFFNFYVCLIFFIKHWGGGRQDILMVSQKKRAQNH